MSWPWRAFLFSLPTYIIANVAAAAAILIAALLLFVALSDIVAHKSCQRHLRGALRNVRYNVVKHFHPKGPGLRFQYFRTERIDDLTAPVIAKIRLDNISADFKGLKQQTEQNNSDISDIKQKLPDTVDKAVAEAMKRERLNQDRRNDIAGSGRTLDFAPIVTPAKKGAPAVVDVVDDDESAKSTSSTSSDKSTSSTSSDKSSLSAVSNKPTSSAKSKVATATDKSKAADKVSKSKKVAYKICCMLIEFVGLVLLSMLFFLVLAIIYIKMTENWIVQDQRDIVWSKLQWRRCHRSSSHSILVSTILQQEINPMKQTAVEAFLPRQQPLNFGIDY